MNEFLTLLWTTAFQSFWHFVGCFMLVSIPFTFAFNVINRTLRHWNIRKHGYPPAHCDADGDFPAKDDDD
jgi:hypothetical protein